MCFTAAFGTPAVCCHSYLLRLEGLIVLLHGRRRLDCSFQDTEAATGVCQAWLPSLCSPSSAALSALQKVTGAAAPAIAKHTDTPEHSQNDGTPTKSLLMVPNAPAKQHPSGRRGIS